MTRQRIVWASLLVVAVPVAAQSSRTFSLQTTKGLRLQNVVATPATLDGKMGVRITGSEEMRQRLERTGVPDLTQAAQAGVVDQIAVIEGVQFGNGVIEAEIAGAPQAGAAAGARGFVGIAFRVQDDLRTYDAFYLRPTNGRADDQVRRNHSAQYIAHPAWTWNRLRTETPEKYESYVDLAPGVWTKVRIEVRGQQARLFVHGQPQPTLVINDVKSGPNAKGGVALWIDVGTEAHFRDLTVTPEQ